MATVASASIMAVSQDAHADEALHSGLELGLRTGYALPLGDALKDIKMKDGVSGKIPLQLDIGYRVMPQLYVGAFFEYGIMLQSSRIKDFCDAAKLDCSASTLRFGANVQYHFLTQGTILPWAGVGAGYEIFSGKTGDLKSSYSGLEFLNVQLGGDFLATSSLRIGPVVGFSLGQFSSRKFGNESNDIPDEGKAFHQWLTLGIRGAYGL